MVILKGKPHPVFFFRKMTGFFFLDLLWARELVRLKALCVGYTHNFFMNVALLEKFLRRNEFEVRPLFHQHVELKLMKIRNFEDQNPTAQIRQKNCKNFCLKKSRHIFLFGQPSTFEK